MLAGCSDYFRAMFSHDMLESRATDLELPGLPEEGFEPLLDYAYSGKLRLNMHTLGDILAAASFLQVSFYS